LKFLDANVILRYLTRDDETKAESVYQFLQRVGSGDEEVTTTEAILIEVVYVLASPRLYGLGPDDIRARLVPILNLRGLKLPHKQMYLDALDRYVAFPFLDFEDALAVAQMDRKQIEEILSYDRDFDRVSGIRRTEP
jgi:predicted nucleic acid-binding protein